MRFHLPALPGQPVTRQNSTCAFTQKIVGFARMMVPRGHEVLIYGGAEHERTKALTNYIDCYENIDKPAKFGEKEFRRFNLAATLAIDERAETDDFIGLVGGRAQKLIATAAPDIVAVEFGIGHGGSFAEYRIFESYAWMHGTYGAEVSEPNKIEPNWYDAVIPGYFDPDDFTYSAEKDDYLLFIGRLMPSKGPHIAEQVAKATDRELIICGADNGYEPEYGKNLGVVKPKKRAELLSKAHALIAPTTYCEPFGNVVIEAQLSGTPTITTDWGAFTETNVHEKTGFRCRTLGEFAYAVEHVSDLDAETIRDHAIANYSYDAIAPRYEAYFEGVADRRKGGGWPSGWNGLLNAQRYGPTVS